MSHMTKLPGVPDKDSVIPGMAFFPGTGPEDKTCGDCQHLGYYRESGRTRWDHGLQREVAKTYRARGCAKFKALSGRHGPGVSADCKACKYFEQRQ